MWAEPNWKWLDAAPRSRSCLRRTAMAVLTRRGGSGAGPAIWCRSGGRGGAAECGARLLANCGAFRRRHQTRDPTDERQPTNNNKQQAMTPKHRRLTLIAAGVGVLGLAVALVLSALKDSIVFFNSPSDLVEKHVAPGTRIRLAGLVEPR